MGAEITRASDQDRQRYEAHLSWLYAHGFITEAEAESLREQILAARSLKVLYDTLDGMPLPPEPAPRDWGMPKRFVPATAAGALAGIMIAVLPTTALAHHADTVSNVLSAASVVTGLVIVIVSVIILCYAAVSWDDIGSEARARRRAQDKAR